MNLYDPCGQRLYINDDERQRFVNAALSCEYPKRQFGLLLALTGCRHGEGRAFRLDDIQAQAQRVTLHTLKRRSGKPPREVPVDPLLIEELLSIEHRCHSSGLFWHQDGRKVPRTTAYRWIKELMDAARIVGKQASPKGLRHGFAAWAQLSGVPLDIIQKWLGHASLETTMIYTSLCGREEMRVAARMWQTQNELTLDSLVEVVLARIYADADI